MINLQTWLLLVLFQNPIRFENKQSKYQSTTYWNFMKFNALQAYLPSVTDTHANWTLYEDNCQVTEYRKTKRWIEIYHISW